MALLLLLLFGSSNPHPAVKTIPLLSGTTITESIVIRRGTYRLPSDSNDGTRAVITIAGSNITVDFNGATLAGTPQDTPPDKRHGTAVRVTGANVTIKNARVRGYVIGLIARDAPGIRIVNSDFSYNWKQRLYSTPERESESDWLTFHHNEKDEWLRYGCGIYLRRSDGFEVRNVRVEGGQNGLMLVESNRGLAWNNSFSFLSGVGLAMYRSSNNRVMYNRIDWCVRGYSHGVYNRGQDSAGILVYEQSNNNLFAYNSVTHGGDGFFLWAGQTTMDTGNGGCNGNLVYGNDFSHAPANGIEATFSRNDFVNNLVMECWHGIWAGYSFESRFLDNYFAFNAVGIAIEHGQQNAIAQNTFYRDNEAILLWQTRTEDPNWGYPKHRDTRSRDYIIEHNLFSDISLNALNIRDTTGVLLTANTFRRNARVFKIESDARLALDGNWVLGPAEPIDSQQNVEVRTATMWVPPIEPAPPRLPATILPNGRSLIDYSDENRGAFDARWSPGLEGADAGKLRRLEGFTPPRLPGGSLPFLAAGHRRGRQYILVDEWGPYDFKSPILWPRLGGQADLKRFEILGPPGRWRLTALRGAGSISRRTGQVPGFVEVSGTTPDLRIELEYIGEAVLSPFGVRTAAGRPCRFGYPRPD